EGKAFESKLIKKEESNKTFIEDQELEITDIKKGSTHTIQDILFETNSSTIDPASKLVLEAFAAWMNENKEIKIEIQGHTDDVGGEDDNLALSKDRAFSVMEFLIELKVVASRLSFKGYGESQPKYENSSDSNRSKNRRTDFLIL
ncbi:MAG: OmpA family protein, partial [Bacteroidota bacterium]|nr:OmpA family protein [Bacteroidota bacterium]